MYHRIRTSELVRFLTNGLKKRQYHEFQEELHFISQKLGTRAFLVYDLGASLGDSTFEFAQFGCKIVAVEPETYNFDRLRRRFQGYAQITLINKAVSDKIGFRDLHRQANGSGLHTFEQIWVDAIGGAKDIKWRRRAEFGGTVSVYCTNLSLLFSRYGCPSFLKLDVEGHEWNILAQLTDPIAVITFEAILPEFRENTKSIVSHLNSLSSGVYFKIKGHQGCLSVQELQDRINQIEASTTLNISCYQPDLFFA